MRFRENENVNEKIKDVAEYLGQKTPTLYGDDNAIIHYSGERITNSGWFDHERGVQSVVPLIFHGFVTKDGKGYCTDWEEDSNDILKPELNIKNSKIVKQVQEWLDDEANFAIEWILKDKKLSVEDLQSMDDDEWEEIRDDIEQGDLESYMSDINLEMSINIMEDGNSLDCFIEIFDNGSGKKPFTVFEKSIKGNFDILSTTELFDCADMLINQNC